MNTPLSHKDASVHGIITDQQKLLVSRHWARKLALFSSKAATSALLGNTRSRFRGRGMEFEEVRRYQPGDDIRTIDWKVTARASGTYTKLFREERERPCHIIVDQRSAMFFGSTQQFKSVLAAELATALAWASLASGDRIGGQVIGDTVELDVRAKNNRHAVMKLIHNIHTLNTQLLEQPTSVANSKLSLTHCLNECSRVVRPGSAVFVISDFNDLNSDSLKILTSISQHNDLTLVHVFDPIEQALPQRSTLPVSNGQESKNVSISGKVHQTYKDSFNTHAELISRAAALAKAHLMKASTTVSAKDTLIQAYRG